MAVMNQSQTHTDPQSPTAPTLRQRSWLGAVGRRLFGVWGARIGLAWISLITFFAVFGPLLASSHPYLMKAASSDGGEARWSSPLLASLTPIDVTLLLLALACAVLLPVRRLPGLVRVAAVLWLGCVIVPSAYWAVLWDAWDQSRKANPDAWLDAVLGAKQVLLPVAVGAAVCLAGLVLLPQIKAPLGLKLAVLVGGLVIALVLTQVAAVNPPKNVVLSQYREMQAAGQIEAAYFPPIPYSPEDTLSDLPIDGRTASPGLHPTEQEIARDMKTAALQELGLVDQSDTATRTIKDAREAITGYTTRYRDRPGANERVLLETQAKVDALAATPQRTRLHLMGTTDKGQDLASRMIHASRIALAIGLVATSIAVVIGVTIGALMGYFSGWIDLIGMRLVEVFSAIPVIFLLIAIVAFWGRSLMLMMVVLGLTGWVGYALFVRAEFLKLRKLDYVMAARASGTGLFSILFRHMLPNGVTPVLVSASFGIAGMILTEATLSFIGLGLEDEPSWGQMLSNAAGVGGRFYWWLAVYPVLAIFFTVFAYNLVGEALRDALDPRAAK